MKVCKDKLKIFSKSSEDGYYRDEQRRLSIFYELINSEEYNKQPIKKAFAGLPDAIQAWWLNRY
jgi:hypothetical protein|tara:strand:- start:2611 stop:2802 length:192 start_codon:yes stop_codon:yes gene_type:complete